MDVASTSSQSLDNELDNCSRDVLPISDDSASPRLVSKQVKGSLFCNINSSGEQIPTSKKKKRPVPARPCPFCLKMKYRLSRHMKTVHSNESEIKKMKLYSPIKSQQHITTLRRRGILLFNKQQIAQGSSELAVEKRGKKDGNIIMCSGCNSFLLKQYFCTHKCTAKSKAKLKLTNIKNNIKSSEFTEKILPHFRGIYSTEICKDDTIVNLGLQYYTKSTEPNKYEEHRKCTMKYMRSLYQISIAFAKEGKAEGRSFSTIDIFKKSNIPMLEATVDILSSINGKISYSAKSMYGYTIKTAANSLKPLSEMADHDNANGISDFLESFQPYRKNHHSFADKNANNNSMKYLRQLCNLPNGSVAAGILQYAEVRLEELMKKKSIDEDNYIKIRRLVSSILVLKNIGGRSDPGRLTCKQLDGALVNNWISDEKSNLEGYIAFIDCKDSTDSVGLLITLELVGPIKFLASDAARRNAMIPIENKWVFANTRGSLFYASGYDELVKTQKASGIKGRLTAILSRHPESTQDEVSSSADEKNNKCCSSLRRSTRVTNTIYQAPQKETNLIASKSRLKTMTRKYFP